MTSILEAEHDHAGHDHAAEEGHAEHDHAAEEGHAHEEEAHAGHDHAGHSHGPASAEECVPITEDYDINLRIAAIFVIMAATLIGNFIIIHRLPQITLKEKNILLNKTKKNGYICNL